VPERLSIYYATSHSASYRNVIVMIAKGTQLTCKYSQQQTQPFHVHCHLLPFSTLSRKSVVGCRDKSRDVCFVPLLSNELLTLTTYECDKPKDDVHPDGCHSMLPSLRNCKLCPFERRERRQKLKWRLGEDCKDIAFWN